MQYVPTRLSVFAKIIMSKPLSLHMSFCVEGDLYPAEKLRHTSQYDTHTHIILVVVLSR